MSNNEEILSVCNKIGCTKTPDFTVHFALRVHPNHEPAITTALVAVCAEHADVKFNDFATEKGWEQICKAFDKIGRQRPVKEYSYLELKPIK